MPDWSYHTLLRPLLFRLPAEQARGVVLRALRSLATHATGAALIDFMGHMRPPSPLRRSAWGLTFDTPIGIGAGLDPSILALPALARFGVGLVEVGPVTLEPIVVAHGLERRPEQRAIWRVDAPVNAGVDVIADRLAAMVSLPIPLGVRVAHQPGLDPVSATHECVALIERLAPLADFFTLETTITGTDRWTWEQWREHLDALQIAVKTRSPDRPLLLCVAPDMPARHVDHLIPLALDAGISGVVISGGMRTDDGARLIGAPTRERSLALVRSIHQRWGGRVAIIGTGGIHQPQDALDLLAAGASFVQLCSGLIYSGPGLPKRTNEALLFTKQPALARSPSRSWIWIVMLGLGMILGGMLAWLVAATRVVLPYDEAFVGLSRADLDALNARILSFMAHDRVTLAGTMISIGVLYAQLALWALRDGAHWAWRTVAAYLLCSVLGSCALRPAELRGLVGQVPRHIFA